MMLVKLLAYTLLVVGIGLVVSAHPAFADIWDTDNLLSWRDGDVSPDELGSWSDEGCGGGHNDGDIAYTPWAGPWTWHAENPRAGEYDVPVGVSDISLGHYGGDPWPGVRAEEWHWNAFDGDDATRWNSAHPPDNGYKPAEGYGEHSFLGAGWDGLQQIAGFRIVCGTWPAEVWDLYITSDSDAAYDSLTGWSLVDGRTDCGPGGVTTIEGNWSAVKVKLVFPVDGNLEDAGIAEFQAYGAEQTHLAGDADTDMDVDGVDLAMLGLNWSPGPNGKTWDDGDSDGDFDVDGVDLAALGLNWAPGGYGATAVPEPATIALLCLGVVGRFACRRRRRPAARAVEKRGVFWQR